MSQLTEEDLQPLGEYLHEQHGLVLTFTELFDVWQVVEQIQEKNKPYIITFEAPSINPFQSIKK